MNMLFHNRYLLERVIGRGSFGEVWLATDTLIDKNVAIKIYASLDADGIKQFITAFTEARNLSHPNLMRLNHLDVYEGRPYFVMPYYCRGAAEQLIGNTKEQEIWLFIHDVAAGLAYMHAQYPPLVHQDIKPANIMIGNDNHFVISDFGISKQVRETLRRASSNNTAGATSYMAPERFLAKPQTIVESDIWSLGVSAYELAIGELPFMGLGGGMMNAGAEIPRLEEPYSQNLSDIIADCFSKDPSERPTAQQLEEYTAAILQGETQPQTPWRKKTVPTILNRRIMKVFGYCALIFAVATFFYFCGSSVHVQCEDEDSALIVKPVADMDTIRHDTIRNDSDAICEQEGKVILKSNRSLGFGLISELCRKAAEDVEDRSNDRYGLYPIIPEDFVLVAKGILKNKEERYSKEAGYYNFFKEYPIDSFYICKYELTQGEYRRIMGELNVQNFNFPVEPHCKIHTEVRSDCIPVLATYLDFAKYCNKRSKQEGYDGFYIIENDQVSFNPEGNGYRLLFALEWTYAAKGGNKNDLSRYVGGNVLKEVAWYSENSSYRPHCVGTKAANTIGIFDMAGNVSEMLESKIIYGQFHREAGNDYLSYPFSETQFRPEDNATFHIDTNTPTGTRIALVPRNVHNNNYKLIDYE